MKSVAYVLLIFLLMPHLARAGDGWQEFAVRPTTDDQERPDIWGTTVVWHQFVAEYGDYDICITDVNDAAEPFFLMIGDANDQMNPAVYDNIVVWQDNRDGNSQIYAVVLEGPAIAQCTSNISGDINGDCIVDFADFTLMASYWLECHLEPEEACWP